MEEFPLDLWATQLQRTFIESFFVKNSFEEFESFLWHNFELKYFMLSRNIFPDKNYSCFIDKLWFPSN